MKDGWYRSKNRRRRGASLEAPGGVTLYGCLAVAVAGWAIWVSRPSTAVGQVVQVAPPARTVAQTLVQPGTDRVISPPSRSNRSRSREAPPVETPTPVVSASGQAENVIAFSMVNGEQRQLWLVDVSQGKLAVYGIDPSGEVALQSVRNFRYDLRLEGFAEGAPSSHDIRKMLARPD